MRKNLGLVVVSVLVVFCALGIGRFTFGMMLPSTQAGLGVTTAQMGLVSGVNFFGYMVALFVYERLSSLLGEIKLMLYSILAIALSFFIIAFTANIWLFGFVYFFTGVASSFANVAITVLVANSFESSKRGTAFGFMVMGSGIAILLSGAVAPYFTNFQYGWIAFGVIVLMAFFAIYSTTKKSSHHHQSRQERATLAWSEVYAVGTIYMLFGILISVFVTFFVSSVIAGGAHNAGFYWMVFGTCSIFSGLIFGKLSDKIGRLNSLICIFVVQSFAFAFQIYEQFLSSAMLFGVCAWSVPSVISALSGDLVAKEKVGLFFSRVTILFGLGQIAGPVIAGVMIDYFGSYREVFMLCLAVGLVCIGLSRRLHTRQNG